MAEGILQDGVRPEAGAGGWFGGHAEHEGPLSWASRRSKRWTEDGREGDAAVQSKGRADLECHLLRVTEEARAPCWPRRVTGKLTNEVDLGRKLDRKVVVRGQGPFRLQLSLPSRPVPASIEPGPRFDLVPGGGSSARARQDCGQCLLSVSRLRTDQL